VPPTVQDGRRCTRSVTEDDGSIGWWDSVYLPLDAGDNELAVTVSETFGGWGLQARFPDTDGIAFA
jgi:hypothetical protein